MGDLMDIVRQKTTVDIWVKIYAVVNRGLAKETFILNLGC
jgi:hypothetical protein